MKKLTVASATLLLLTTQAVHAEIASESTTTQETTAEIQTSENTTFSQDVTNSETPTAQQDISKEPEQTTEITQKIRSRSKRDVTNNIDDYYKQQNYTGFVTQNGDTYYYLNGTKLTSQWKYIHNQYYYINENGQKQTNTLIDGYVMDEDGIMARNRFVTINDHRYFADEHGKAVTSIWKKIDGKWYSFKDNGVLRQNEFYDYYYLKADGTMADNEWIFDKYYNSYFFIKQGGAYANKEWKGSYYLKAGGYMAKSEFVYDDHYKATYYFEESGQYVGGKWIEVNGKKYHFQMDGVLETNKWIGNYYVKSDGAMAKNEWFFDKNYGSYFYLADDGKYIGGNRWYQVAGDWYYFIADGQMASHKWIGNYYVKSDGRMAVNEWIYDHNYSGYFYLRGDGVYVRNIFTIDGKKHAFQDNGLWIAEVPDPVNYGNYKNVVFLDPGHGGRDPGAVYNGLREKDLNMSIYRKLRSELEKLGYTVLTSRDTDVYVDFVTERSKMVNKTDADIFISIHFNATGVPGANRSGVETYIYEPDEDIKPRINKWAHNDPTRLSESKRLADNIHNSVVSLAGANDRGVHGANYAVLRETVKPAVLLELGYMDSPEYKKISDDKYQNKLVEGIVTGLRNFYKTAK